VNYKQDTANIAEEMVKPSSVDKREDVQHIHPVVTNMRFSKTKALKHKEKEIPDTLGNSIWQSEKNVILAIQILGECEAIIEKSEQMVRNNIVKATFNAVPQPTNVILVTNEAGDYYVSDTNEQTIIEL
jgi:hypothetical protein